MVLELGAVGSKAKFLGGRPEIVNVALGHLSDHSSGQSILVGFHDALGEGHVQSVVPDGPVVVWVGECVQLEVGVLRDLDRSPGLGRDGINDNVPLVALYRVCDLGLYAAGHTSRVRRVVQTECDGFLGSLLHAPESERPVVGPAMKRVGSIILHRVICHIVNGEGAIANAVGITSRNGIVNRVARIDSWRGVSGEVRGLGKVIRTVVRCVVVTQYDIALNAVLVFDPEIGQGGRVRNEL